MGEFYVYVKVISGRESERQLLRLLRRHRDRILAVALVVAAESQQQLGGLAKAYQLRPLRLPASLLLEDEG